MTTERVTLTVENHVGIVKFNRADKMNALDDAQIDAIMNVSVAIQSDARIRAVVLAGEGRAFCAGIDVSTLANAIGNDGKFADVVPRLAGKITNRWQEIVWQWRAMQVPVIAAVHGVAYGGGMQIMMGADIRIVEPNTKLSIMEMKWGIIPDMAGSQLFRHTVRDDVLRMLTYTHKVFSGTEALQYGFATQLSDNPLEDAIAMAQEIASKNPTAVVQAKKILNAAPYLSVEDSFMLESEVQEDLIGSPNQLEAVFAGLQRRAGDFENYRE